MLFLTLTLTTHATVDVRQSFSEAPDLLRNLFLHSKAKKADLFRERKEAQPDRPLNEWPQWHTKEKLCEQKKRKKMTIPAGTISG